MVWGCEQHFRQRANPGQRVLGDEVPADLQGVEHRVDLPQCQQQKALTRACHRHDDHLGMVGLQPGILDVVSHRSHAPALQIADILDQGSGPVDEKNVLDSEIRPTEEKELLALFGGPDYGQQIRFAASDAFNGCRPGRAPNRLEFDAQVARHQGKDIGRDTRRRSVGTDELERGGFRMGGVAQRPMRLKPRPFLRRQRVRQPLGEAEAAEAGQDAQSDHAPEDTTTRIPRAASPGGGRDKKP